MSIVLVLQTARRVASDQTRPVASRRNCTALLFGLAALAVAQSGAHAQPQPAAQPALGTIEGRTTLKSTGEPVADADVRLVNRNQSIIPLQMTPTRSDAEGKFVFRGVPPGKYRLVAFHERLASRVKMFQGLELTVDKQGQASESPVLQLEPANSIRVHVDSQVTGQPLVKARVRLSWTDTDRDHFTDEAGNVEIHGLTPDTWTIEVTAAGHAEEERRLTLTPGQLLNEASVALSAGGVVKGRVVDAAGQPLKRVGVSAISESFQGGQIEYVETDVDGRYAFDYLPLIPLQLSFSKDGFLPLRKDVALSAAEAARTLDLQLEARPYGGGVLVGVANAEGEPIAKATIKNHGNSSRNVREGTTNDEGLCLLEDLFQSSSGYELVVRAAGYAPQAVTCKPGPKDAPTQLAVILERGHRIKGRVVLADTDQPAAGVRVYFAGGERGIGGIGDRVDTDKDGRFASDSLPSPCTFTFYPLPGYSQIDDLVLELNSDEEVVIRLERAAAIRGRVVDAVTGDPVTHFNVKLGFCRQREAGDPEVGGISSSLVDPGSEFTGKSGEFEVGSFPHLAPFQVTIDAPGYERTVLKRVVATRAGEEAPVIKLARPNPKSLVEVGGVIRLEGRALTGVQVRLIVSAELLRKKNEFPFNWTMIESGQIERQPDVLQYLTTTTDADGKFKFQQVRAGIPYQIVYWGGGAAPARYSLFTPMSAAELSAVQIEAAMPAKLIVKIDRTTYPDAHQLTLSGSESGSGHRSSELAPNDPTVAFDGLAAGKYYLSLSGPYLRLEGDSLTSSWTRSQGVQLVEGDEQFVTFGGSEASAGNRKLIGQLGVELNVDFPRDKQNVHISLQPMLPEPVPPPFPGDAEQDGGVAARLWMQNWLKSDAGRDWQKRRAAYEELQSLAPSFTAHPDDEGRFEFRDVPPGNYRAQIYVKNGRPATLPLIKVEPRADAAADAVQDLGVMNPTVR